jgi:hypothetical protein
MAGAQIVMLRVLNIGIGSLLGKCGIAGMMKKL